EDPPAPDSDAFEAPERCGEPLEPRSDLLELGAGRAGEGCRGDRVVDVVQAGQPKLDPGRPLWCVEQERSALEALQGDLPSRDLEWGTGMVAAGAAVVA